MTEGLFEVENAPPSLHAPGEDLKVSPTSLHVPGGRFKMFPPSLHATGEDKKCPLPTPYNVSCIYEF